MPKAKRPEPSTPEWTAERIRSIRERLDITQTELANEIGVVLRCVQYWEEGRKPSRLAVKALEAIEAKSKLRARQS